MSSALLEARSYRPFKSSEEYLYAMREDLAEWLNTMYPELHINVNNFMDRLDTGVALCKHANNVRQAAEEYVTRRQARNKSITKSITSGLAGPVLSMGNVQFLPAAKSGTFFARDNVSNFITWCRKSLQIFECLLFETDDLIMRKNEKHVILCLLEVARRGAKFGMLAPMLVQMERQIDREIAADNKANAICSEVKIDDNVRISVTGVEMDLFDSESEEENDTCSPMLMYGPHQQIITNDLKSLDEMVRDLVEKCTCPSQFPMVRVSEGKYRIGDTKVLIFVRILRSHVMVRVGGGWDTLSHYLDKHDPCRCKAQHRSSVAARLITKSNQPKNGIELHRAQVVYERLAVPMWKQQNDSQQCSPNLDSNSSTTSTPVRTRSRSRSPAQYKTNHSHNAKITVYEKGFNVDSTNLTWRSPSPNPRQLEAKKKQNTKELSHKPEPKANTNQASVHFECDLNDFVNEAKLENVAEDKYNMYDNVSDNGSEISDEGYRSLGIIHSQGPQKRVPFNNQTINKDTKSGVVIDKTTSHSNTCSSQPTDNKFEESGLNITETEITINIDNSINFPEAELPVVYDNEASAFKNMISSKIPVSPELSRRKKAENASSLTVGKLTAINRKIPTYRSMRKTNQCLEDKDTCNNSTVTHRQTMLADTFETKPISVGTVSSRNSPSRSPVCDKNSSKAHGNFNSTISNKQGHCSNLAQQLIDAAANGQNDSQIIFKVKELLSKYSNDAPQSNDFTEEWVTNNKTTNYNSNHDLKQCCNMLTTSEADSCKEVLPMTSPRRDKGISKIPTPVLPNTGPL